VPCGSRRTTGTPWSRTRSCSPPAAPLAVPTLGAVAAAAVAVEERHRHGRAATENPAPLGDRMP
ncbi:hypothetical protein ACTHS2_35870, partial [Streptomyces pseudogriseolus]